MANFWGLGISDPEPVLRIRIGYNNADPDTAVETHLWTNKSRP